MISISTIKNETYLPSVLPLKQWSLLYQRKEMNFQMLASVLKVLSNGEKCLKTKKKRKKQQLAVINISSYSICT